MSDAVALNAREALPGRSVAGVDGQGGPSPRAELVESEVDPPAFPVKRAMWIPPLAVDVRTAAAMFSLSVKTWQRMDAATEIPAGFHLMRRKVWRVSDLERWAALGFPDRQRFNAAQRHV